MEFAWALEKVKEGHRIRIRSWKPPERCVIQCFDSEGRPCLMVSLLSPSKRNPKAFVANLRPWQALDEDLFSEDWAII